jgi:hypothetical protein
MLWREMVVNACHTLCLLLSATFNKRGVPHRTLIFHTNFCLFDEIEAFLSYYYLFLKKYEVNHQIGF